MATGLVTLVGAVALGGGAAPAAAATATADPDTATAATAPLVAQAEARRLAAANNTPLRVTIDALAPSYLPRQGVIEVRGTVTNRTEESWTNIKVYPALGDDLAPMRNAAQLAAAAAEPASSYAGTRTVGSGEEAGTIEELAPGATASYVTRLPATAYTITERGVYWFGVQALGTDQRGARDLLADGKARTFLPYVPQGPRAPSTSLPTALVVPLVRDIPYAEDGALDDLPDWRRSLGSTGRLSRVVDFVDAADEPVTWLVDPALPDAVSRLALGNPARSLGPTRTTDEPAATDSPGSGGAPSATASAGGEPGPGGSGDGSGDEADQVVPDQLDPETRETATLAADWLATLRGLLTRDADRSPVLTVPYGNLDVPGAVRHRPALYDLARAQDSSTLTQWGVGTTPALTAPNGYLDAASIAATDDDATILVSDEVVGASSASAASVAGHRLAVLSSGAAAGGPLPGTGLTMIGLRQRILSEAAVRVVKRDPQPLVVMLPTDWDLADGASFFAGLDVDWLDLRSVSDALQDVVATSLEPSDLDYPALRERREVDAETFASVDELIDAGDTLQNLLTVNNEVAGSVTDQALSGASYGTRGSVLAGRASLNRSRDWIEERLGAVRLQAPRGITLSSTDGGFNTTISNTLDEPVRVAIEARSDAGLEVEPSGPIDVAAGGRVTVLLQARATSNRVHNVTLLLTDAEGTPIGATDELPIRSAQVSGVIWLIMGTGATILFGAIGLRLLRRVRGSRRTASAT